MAGILGLLGHGRDSVEADVGEEENSGGLEDAASAVGDKWGVVFGVGFCQSCNDDEEDDDNVDDGGDVVQAGGALCGEDGDETNDDEDGNGDQVEVAVIRGKAMRMDAEIVGVAVAEGGEVGGPGTGHGGAAYHVFKEDVAGGDEGHEVPKLYPQVGE